MPLKSSRSLWDQKEAELMKAVLGTMIRNAERDDRCWKCERSRECNGWRFSDDIHLSLGRGDPLALIEPIN
jgi:hypothetical protein